MLRDPRRIRLYDIQGDQLVSIRCACGHSSQWAHGTLQRLNRLASDVLVYDLQFRLRCEHCNARGGFRIAVETWGGAGLTKPVLVDEVIVVEGAPARRTAFAYGLGSRPGKRGGG